MHTAGKKTLVRVFGSNTFIFKGFSRLNLQPVQLIFPTSITDKKIHQPSKDIIRRVRVLRFSAWSNRRETDGRIVERPRTSITDEKSTSPPQLLSPGPKSGLERRPLRFSTICAKNQVLKLNIDKVTVILRLNFPFLAHPPCKFSNHRRGLHVLCIYRWDKFSTV